MAKYQIKLPDGAAYEIEAPDDMPEAQVREKFEASMAQAPPPEATAPPADDWRGEMEAD